MDAYSLKQHKDTGELHLFKGKFTPEDPKFKCNTAQMSECREMNRNDSAANRFTCETEDQARKKIAEIGRPVCGTCVSTLYTTKQAAKR